MFFHYVLKILFYTKKKLDLLLFFDSQGKIIIILMVKIMYHFHYKQEYYIKNQRAKLTSNDVNRLLKNNQSKLPY